MNRVSTSLKVNSLFHFSSRKGHLSFSTTEFPSAIPSFFFPTTSGPLSYDTVLLLQDRRVSSLQSPLPHQVDPYCYKSMPNSSEFFSGVWQGRETEAGVVPPGGVGCHMVPELFLLTVLLSRYSFTKILCRLIEVWSWSLRIWTLSLPVRSLSLRAVSAISCTVFVASMTEVLLKINSLWSI